MPTRRAIAAAASQPLGAGEPAGSLKAGVKVSVEPAGRSGVFEKGRAVIDNRVVVHADLYDTDTGAVLALSGATIQLEVINPDRSEEAPNTMTLNSSRAGRYTTSFVPVMTGVHKLAVVITQWKVRVKDRVYVGAK